MKKIVKNIDQIQTYVFEHRDDGRILLNTVNIDLAEIAAIPFRYNNVFIILKSASSAGKDILICDITEKGKNTYRKLVRDWKKFKAQSISNWAWDYLRRPAPYIPVTPIHPWDNPSYPNDPNKPYYTSGTAISGEGAIVDMETGEITPS